MHRARWLIPGLALLLGACAGSPAHPGASADPENDDFDSNKVDTVTQWARVHGATVVWVNYPTKLRPRDVAQRSTPDSP